MKKIFRIVLIIIGLNLLFRVLGGMFGGNADVATAPEQTNTATAKPRPTAKPASITVNAGELRDYESQITKDGVINVYMLDGTLDEREDDLKQLCLDWHFYRTQILKFSAEGKTEKADSARNSFDQINYWLEDYDEDDVSFMLALIEEKGW